MNDAPLQTKAGPPAGRADITFHFISRHLLFLVGASLFGSIILIALFAPFISPYDPNAINFADKLMAPGWDHLLGTDTLGRDILSRIIFGSRTSLTTGFVVLGICLAIGIPVGLISGYFGGRVDMILMRITDVFLAFPPLLLPIAITADLGTGLFNVMFALAVSWFPWYARVLRGAVIHIRQELFVDSARAMGVSDMKIIFRHILPNAWTPLIVQISMDFGWIILAAAGLSFIGVGAQPPTIDWGLMITSARSRFLDAWWMLIAPGAAIFITVLAANLIGDGVQDIMDPKHRSER